ncbi:alpha/beta fold hydrolase [Microbacterium terrisoli]|jgi:pimeloyl-ACP methyl ester carboxylesterase|uniref:alpha/beta fold hydrolase n=1 Tax=Microbacterium terrisoli TaxID=3242192 RepID=UPI0028045F0D|nr:alpha/beta hydrolase [Microbacterium protaetiae]
MTKDGAIEDGALDRRTVVAHGLRMNVVERGGDGPDVLLLHGFPQSSRSWMPVADRLAAHAHIVVPDLRGAGATDAPRGGYDSETVSRDVLGLLDELGIERAVLVAHDWSALVGFDLCLAHPERFSGYIAIGVPAPYIRMTPRLAGALMAAMPHLWFQWVIATPGFGPWLLSHGRQRFAHWLLESFAVHPMDADDIAAHIAALREPARARAASQLYRHLILPGFVKIMAGRYRGRVLCTRTLVLFGGDDGLIPRGALTIPEEDAPHTRVQFVPGGAHFVVDDQPEQTARVIAQFIDELAENDS